MKKKITLAFVFLIIFSYVCAVPAAADPTNYSYIFSFWYEEIAQPDPYFVAATFMGQDFTDENGRNIGNFRNPQGIYVRDNVIYICDTGNNRVVIIEYIERTDTYELKKVISSVEIRGEQSTLKSPHGIFVTAEGELFIGDTDNLRILRLDSDYNFINHISIYEQNENGEYITGRNGKPIPISGIIDRDLDFLPCKLVVDKANRVFVQARNVNKGFMEFTVNGEFRGYVGASRVTVDVWDYFWKMISSDAQRSQMESFVPTEYNNLYVDHDGFLYATLSTFADSNLFSTATPAHPVRRLNAEGTDILVRNGRNYRGDIAPIGDWYWGEASAGAGTGSSKFSSVIAFENDSYICLDRNRGRLFAYDFQGNLIYIFGGTGSKEGYFLDAVDMCSMGFDLFVLDARTAKITHFKQTDYGKFINEAMIHYYDGNYDLSAEYWDRVLKLNGNYDLAYIGKGRAALRNEDYAEAMSFYKAKHDERNYGKAFQLFRKEWIEENIIPIIIVCVSFYTIVKVLGIVIRYRRKRRDNS